MTVAPSVTSTLQTWVIVRSVAHLLFRTEQEVKHMELNSENVEEFFDKLGAKSIADATKAIMEAGSRSQIELMEKVRSIIDAGKSRITSLEAAKIIADGGMVYATDFFVPHDDQYWNPTVRYHASQNPDGPRDYYEPNLAIEGMKKGKYRLIIIVEPLGSLEEKDSND